MLQFLKRKSVTPKQVLLMDDNPDDARLLQKLVKKAGHELLLAASSLETLSLAKNQKPSLFFVSLAIDGVNGYELCSRLHENVATSHLPVVLIGETVEKLHRSRAFAAGAAELLFKPLKKRLVLHTIKNYLAEGHHWREVSELDRGAQEPGPESPELEGFKEFVADKLGLSELVRAHLSTASSDSLYPVLAKLNLGSAQVAELIAEFTGFALADEVDPGEAALGMLPLRLCRAHHMIPIKKDDEKIILVLGNPFTRMAREVRKRLEDKGLLAAIRIADPRIIDILCEGPEYEELF